MKYPKMNSIFKRNQQTKKIIFGDYSTPEFEMLKNIEWQFSEKLDGMNVRVEWVDSKLKFYGRTDEAMIPSLLATKLGDLFSSEKFLEVFGAKDVYLFGEGIGKKIQEPIGSAYNADDNDFVLFDVYIANRVNRWIDRDALEGIAKTFGIKVAPIVGSGFLVEGIELVRKGFQSWVGNCVAEGIIARPLHELYTRNGERIITKIKHKDFLGT